MRKHFFDQALPRRALTFAIAALGTALFWLLDLPLPFLFGPLLLSPILLANLLRTAGFDALPIRLLTHI